MSRNRSKSIARGTRLRGSISAIRPLGWYSGNALQASYWRCISSASSSGSMLSVWNEEGTKDKRTIGKKGPRLSGVLGEETRLELLRVAPDLCARAR
jgi:hypothetical protein